MTKAISKGVSAGGRVGTGRLGVAAALLALLCLIGLGLWFGIAHRPAEHAMVMVSIDDCRRSFSKDVCQMIAARAQAVHARTAPRFTVLSTCELSFGAGACRHLVDGDTVLNIYAPRISAIALTRDHRTVVPLYDAPARSEGSENLGRPMAFRGTLVGRLSQPRVGGGEVPVLRDEAGGPLTAEAVRSLRTE